MNLIQMLLIGAVAFSEPVAVVGHKVILEIDLPCSRGSSIDCKAQQQSRFDQLYTAYAVEHAGSLRRVILSPDEAAKAAGTAKELTQAGAESRASLIKATAAIQATLEGQDPDVVYADELKTLMSREKFEAIRVEAVSLDSVANMYCGLSSRRITTQLFEQSRIALIARKVRASLQNEAQETGVPFSTLEERLWRQVSEDSFVHPGFKPPQLKGILNEY
jgi:hypothetical protein